MQLHRTQARWDARLGASISGYMDWSHLKWQVSVYFRAHLTASMMNGSFEIRHITRRLSQDSGSGKGRMKSILTSPETEQTSDFSVVLKLENVCRTNE